MSLHSNGAGALKPKNHHRSPVRTFSLELRDSHRETTINDICERWRNLVTLSVAGLFNVECPQEKSKFNEQGLASKRGPNADAIIISDRSGHIQKNGQDDKPSSKAKSAVTERMRIWGRYVNGFSFV